MAVGYISACLASGLAATVILEFHLTAAPAVSFMIATAAAIPALIAIVIAERRGLGSYRYYAWAGAVIGAILPVLALGRRAEGSLCLLGLALGAAAACLYRRLAGS